MNAIHYYLSNLFSNTISNEAVSEIESQKQKQNGFSLDIIHYKEQGCDAERSTLYFDTIEDMHAFLITQAKHKTGYITYVRGYINGKEEQKNKYGGYGILNGNLDGWDCYITNKTFTSSSWS